MISPTFCDFRFYKVLRLQFRQEFLASSDYFCSSPFRILIRKMTILKCCRVSLATGEMWASGRSGSLIKLCQILELHKTRLAGLHTGAKFVIDDKTRLF